MIAYNYTWLRFIAPWRLSVSNSPASSTPYCLHPFKKSPMVSLCRSKSKAVTYNCTVPAIQLHYLYLQYRTWSEVSRRYFPLRIQFLQKPKNLNSRKNYIQAHAVLVVRNNTQQLNFFYFSSYFNYYTY